MVATNITKYFQVKKKIRPLLYNAFFSWNTLSPGLLHSFNSEATPLHYVTTLHN